MLERIKSVPFIDESEAVKVKSVDGKITLQRTDRVIWACEKTAIEAEGIDCYVEAEKFFALIDEIKSLAQTTCLEVTLKNGAKYELPFLDVSWEAQEMPTEYEDTITFKLTDLILCTLKNLIKPELQCIWIDQNGAVSCDFISACVTSTVRASRGFLLPPDVQELVDGRICKVKVTEDKIFIAASDFDIVTSRPTEGEDQWYQTIRSMTEGANGFTSSEALSIGLKRLVMFADYVMFDGTKATAGSNYEPFAFRNLENNQYEIERLSRILSTAKSITEQGGNLVMKNDSCMFLLSPMEEA